MANIDSKWKHFPYFAIWKDQAIYVGHRSDCIDSLKEFDFPFRVQKKAALQDIEYLEPSNRNVHIGISDLELPPFIIQISFSPSGVLSRSVYGKEASIILGSYSREKLVSLIKACGFQIIQSDKSIEKESRDRIPDDVQIFVWRREGGKCVKCGSQESLEFDHIIPTSKGGSNTARNIQLLCEKCNRSKGSKIGG